MSLNDFLLDGVANKGKVVSAKNPIDTNEVIESSLPLGRENIDKNREGVNGIEPEPVDDLDRGFRKYWWLLFVVISGALIFLIIKRKK